MNVLLIIFNRPEPTARVFERIRQARPDRLFVAADGPRPGRPGERERCEAARKITESVDWPCKVERRYSSENHGCKIGASSAVTWLFEHVEDGMIIEDDCLPDSSFFEYCQAMLERYRDRPEVMMVNGTTVLDPEEASDPSLSYHFSRVGHLWGWGTWRRAWKTYDLTMAHLDELERSNDWNRLFLKRKHFRFWMRHCRHIGEKNVDTWDAQWQYGMLYANGLVVSPNVNLIENIGFGPGATHTTESENEAAVPVRPMAMPLRHPAGFGVDLEADARLMDKVFMRSLWKRIRSRIRLMMEKGL